MDPQVAWQELLDARAREDGPAACSAAEALLGWIERGGFPPQVISSRDMDKDWNAALAMAACQFVLSSTAASDSL